MYVCMYVCMYVLTYMCTDRFVYVYIHMCYLHNYYHYSKFQGHSVSVECIAFDGHVVISGGDEGYHMTSCDTHDVC